MKLSANKILPAVRISALCGVSGRYAAASFQGFLQICSIMLTMGTTVCVVATGIQIHYFERVEGALPAEYLQRKAFPSPRTLPDRPIC